MFLWLSVHMLRLILHNADPASATCITLHCFIIGPEWS